MRFFGSEDLNVTEEESEVKMKLTHKERTYSGYYIAADFPFSRDNIDAIIL